MYLSVDFLCLTFIRDDLWDSQTIIFISIKSNSQNISALLQRLNGAFVMSGKGVMYVRHIINPPG